MFFSHMTNLVGGNRNELYCHFAWKNIMDFNDLGNYDLIKKSTVLNKFNIILYYNPPQLAE